jgi:hypothetical protein
MKIGNLKVQKNYSSGKTKWAILGRFRRGVWEQTNLEGKDLIFDIKYDACCFLLSINEDWNNKGKSYGN